MKPGRIDALTGLRAVAATMVFLYHKRKYWNGHIPVWLLRMLNEFYTGVSVFFVLSGFLIAYTYRDKPLQSTGRYGNYLLGRVLRILPIFLLVLTAKYLVQGFPSAKEAGLTYSLLNGFSDKYNLQGLPQAWSLNVELCFYAVAPMLFYLTNKNIWKALVFQLALLLLFAGIGYGWHTFNGNKDGYLYPIFFLFNGTYPGRCIEFFSGVLLGHWLASRQQVPFAGWHSKTLVGGILVLATTYGLSFFEPNLYKPATEHPLGMALRNLVLPVLVAILIAGLISENTWLKKALQSKLMVLLGNASFVFYLVHSGFLSELIRKKHFLPQMAFVTLWLVSILVYLLIEKPLYHFLKRKMIRPAKASLA